MCLWLAWMRLIVVVRPLPLSLLLSLLSPVVKSHTGKMKPNRGEKWNIDFFFFVFTSDGFFRPLLFTHHPLLSTRQPSRELFVIISHNASLSASLFYFYEVSEGRGYLSRRIKWGKWREWLEMFSCPDPPESRSSWPVPDDQEPTRSSEHTWCPRDWVQKRCVNVAHKMTQPKYCKKKQFMETPKLQRF